MFFLHTKIFLWLFSVNHPRCAACTHKDRYSNSSITVNILLLGSFIYIAYLRSYGPGSSVGIVTGYGLDGPGIESRWRARFSAPVQTGPGAHPAFYRMGTGSFSEVEIGRGVTLTPHALLVPRSKNRVELYLYFP
jgi:hypothetical protein